MADFLTTKVTLGGKLSKLKTVLNSRHPVYQRIVDKWTKLLASFLRRRFTRASRGDGTWPPLAPSTIARRRKRSKAILRDTGLLFSQFSPEIVQAGKAILKGKSIMQAQVSFGGQGKYPDGTSVIDVMSFHQRGGGHLPKRELIVGPDAATRGQMAEVARKEMLKEINGK